MKLSKVIFVATMCSFGVSYAHACAVDAVSAKTDTTITISWDLSSCKQVNSGQKFEICWKKAGNSGNVCIPPTIQRNTETGTATIDGLAPSTTYKIRTRWHRQSAWHDVTTRIVTTNPSPALSGTPLRYEKGTGQKYCVAFFWKNPPPLPQNKEWTITLGWRAAVLFGFSAISTKDVPNAVFNSSTSEFTVTQCGFSNNRKYQAGIFKRFINKTQNNLELISNEIVWK